MSGTSQNQVSPSGQPISSGQPMSAAVPGQPMVPVGQPMVPVGQPMVPAGQQPMMMAVPQPVPVRYVAGPQGGMVFMPQPVNECILYIILIICFVSRVSWLPNQLIVVFFQVII